MLNKRLVITFSIICFAYWCANQSYETDFFIKIHPAIKHCINYFLVVSVALSGYYYFLATSNLWIKVVWMIIYSCIILLIGMFGLIDLFMRFNSHNIRDLFSSLRIFFTSPVPFAVLLFIEQRTSKK